MNFTISKIEKLENIELPIKVVANGNNEVIRGINFRNRNETSMPDVDIDFGDNSLIKDKMVEEWGEDSVAFISNYNTLQLSSLIKDISKREGIDFTEVNKVTKAMLLEATPKAKKKHGIKAGVYTPTFQEVCDFSETLQQFFHNYPEVKEQVFGLIGQPRSIGRHAAGAIIGDYLPKKMPLITSKGIRQTPWAEGQNVRHLEPLGFIKFDILGLETLKTFEDTIVRILKKEGVREPTFEQCRQWYMDNLHPSKLDMNDERVYREVFHEGKYAGIFQFMNSGMQRLGTNAKVNSIEEIATVSAIYRPGPLSANVDKMYVNLKNGTEDVDYDHPLIESILGKTFGLIVFQEDIMNLVNQLGDKITMSDANVLRKLLTKKGLSGTKMKKKKDLYERFVKGCEKKGMSFADAKVLWGKMEYFSGYGFAKCLSGDTLVETQERGVVKITDVEIGEHVNSENGFVRVKQKYEQGKKKVYRIKTSSGKVLKCTLDHKLETEEGMKTLKEIMDRKLKIVTQG